MSSATSSYTMGERRNQYFVNKKIKYVWDEATLVFVKLKSIDEGMMQVLCNTEVVNENDMSKVCSFKPCLKFY